MAMANYRPRKLNDNEKIMVGDTVKSLGSTFVISKILTYEDYGNGDRYIEFIDEFRGYVYVKEKSDRAGFYRMTEIKTCTSCNGEGCENGNWAKDCLDCDGMGWNFKE